MSIPLGGKRRGDYFLRLLRNKTDLLDSKNNPELKWIGGADFAFFVEYVMVRSFVT